jgi:hypothetical protein
MAAAGAMPQPAETTAALPEKAKLRKILGRVGLVLFTACAILGYVTRYSPAAPDRPDSPGPER